MSLAIVIVKVMQFSKSRHIVMKNAVCKVFMRVYRILDAGVGGYAYVEWMT